MITPRPDKVSQATDETPDLDAPQQAEPSLLNLLASEDDVIKNRLVGALVWVVVLLWFVPAWYADPAYQQTAKPEQNQHQAIVMKPLVKPPEVVAEEQAKAMEAAKLQKAQEMAARQARLVQESRVEPIKVTEKMPPKAAAERPADAVSVNKSAVADKGYIVILATFENKQLLDTALEKAAKAGYPLVVKTYSKVADGRTYLQFNLRTQMYDSYDKAQTAQQNLDKILRLKGSFVRAIALKPQN
ncbi:hypothetical protein THMIRHAS_17490 [Thiosulfatimonas sediminis]|uniref:SPOR domain-containing protein n=1 Tax=Thiosulfatimonas sediminis TaxID=2675054 RepID=A0A6F8PWA5_9GAMM|nr:SPOR domain-containing protein [Thiosulfatimonas sediminis]BBP46376.1 hypothetical protein THMIRHAS_17490 [Thiosulfatimonas sediminis]